MSGFLDPPAAFPRDLDVGDGRESLDGLDELHAVVLHQEGQRGTARAAAEALVAPFGSDVEGGGLFLVEGAAGLVGLAGLRQLYARIDEVDDVDPLEKIVDEGLRNTASH